jgi:hypothetical protein
MRHEILSVSKAKAKPMESRSLIMGFKSLLMVLVS